MSGFSLQPGELETVGRDLKRPECVLCTRAGDVVASHWDGGVTHIRADGSQRHILGMREERSPVGTNGCAITADGDFLLADLSEGGGGVWRLTAEGALAPFVLEVDGVGLPPTNFVGVDRTGRTWITVSTRHEPRHDALRRDVADGYIVLADERGARIAADGLCYTNEAIVDPAGEWLYVNETMARRTSRYRIALDGTLGERETVTEYGLGTFPDGLAFDAEGHVWITAVLANSVVRVAPDGSQQVIVEENDPELLREIETLHESCSLTGRDLARIKTEVMKNISSIAFGGPDLKTVYLGNLLDDKLYSFRSPVAGAKPSHWEVNL